MKINKFLTDRRKPELKELFLERMQKLLSDKKDFQNYLDILKIEPVRSIRCNTLKISPQELKKRLEAKGWKVILPWKNFEEVMVINGKLVRQGSQIEITSHSTSSECSAAKSVKKENFSINKLKKSASESEHNFVLIPLEPGELGRSLEHLLGYYYIQELASMLPIFVLNPRRGESLLDLCAAPGSKTTQAAAAMENSGNIIANEIVIGRLRILASNLERCGVANVVITRKDGVALCSRLKKYSPEISFDKILVDAPCSGEGTLRSSPKTYSMWNIKTVKNLPKIQLGLFKAGFEVLKVGGEMVYSTCTHAPEENEGVVDAILKEFGDRIEIEKVKLPFTAREGIAEWEGVKFDKRVKNCARVYPHDNNTEGFFIGKFRKIL